MERSATSAPSQKSRGYPASEKPAGQGRSLRPYLFYMGADEDTAPKADAPPTTFQIQPSFAAAGCHRDFWDGARAVVAREVVDAGDGWAADGGVVAVMVVHVQPFVQSGGSLLV